MVYQKKKSILNKTKRVRSFKKRHISLFKNKLSYCAEFCIKFIAKNLRHYTHPKKNENKIPYGQIEVFHNQVITHSCSLVIENQSLSDNIEDIRRFLTEDKNLTDVLKTIKGRVD